MRGKTKLVLGGQKKLTASASKTRMFADSLEGQSPVRRCNTAGMVAGRSEGSIHVANLVGLAASLTFALAGGH
jgi:hypothetical protein